MRKMIRYAAAVLPLLIPLAGWTTIGEQLNLQSASRVWVEGGSTVRSWSCKAEDVSAVVEATSANSISHTLAGEKAIRAVDLTVPVEKMDCSNGTMNDHMREALKAKEFQAIAFHLTSYDVAKSSDGVSGTLTGTLTLGGVTKTVAIPATGGDLGGALHVTGAYDLKMTDYDLTPPSLMFGRIKVRDVVTVKFDLVFEEADTYQYFEECDHETHQTLRHCRACHRGTGVRPDIPRGIEQVGCRERYDARSGQRCRRAEEGARAAL